MVAVTNGNASTFGDGLGEALVTMTRSQTSCIMSTVLLMFIARTCMLPKGHYTAQSMQVYNAVSV